MKKLSLIMALCAVCFLGFNSCGPSQKELDRQKRIEDSINKIDSDNSVDEANKMLQQADSIEKTKQDSIGLAAKKK